MLFASDRIMSASLSGDAGNACKPSITAHSGSRTCHAQLCLLSRAQASRLTKGVTCLTLGAAHESSGTENLLEQFFQRGSASLIKPMKTRRGGTPWSVWLILRSGF